MRNNFFNKRIPTYLAIILLVLGLTGVVFLANNTTQFQGRAAPNEEPKNIQISNVTSNSFTVSYVTDSEVLGSIQYGTSERNQPNQETSGSTASQLHIITVEGLSPNTTFYFTITSGRNQFTDNGQPFVVKTGQTIQNEAQNVKTITGKIQNPDGSNASNTLVFLTTDNANIISTQTESDGTFEISTAPLLTSDLTSYYPLSENQKMSLSAVSALGDAKALFFLDNSDPLPNIKLESVYNFTLEENTNEPVTDNSVTFPVFREGSTETQNVTITNPENNEGFSDQQPSFEGTALPNEQVEIIIQSNHEIQTTVNADENGNWTFRPDTPLEPGEHTVTVKTRDENGILRILTRSFTVYAQGSQFTEPSVSPPSVTPTATISPTSEPTPTETLTPTPTLIIGIDEPTPTEIADQTPTPTVTPLPIDQEVTPQPTVEPTGSSSGSIALLSSLGILLVGGFFFLFSKMRSL